MKRLIQGLSRRTVVTTFVSVYAAALAMAVFPPFYFAASGVATQVLGIPFSILYWIINLLILASALWALYIVEDIRGELEEALPDGQPGEN